MDISFFGTEELRRLMKEIEEELKSREEKSERLLPIDLFAKQARRDIHCPNCGSHDYRTNGTSRKRTVLECGTCGKKFGYLSGSMMDDSKLSLLRMYQLTMLILLDLPVWVVSYLTGLNQKTVQFWRYRLTDVAVEYLGKQMLSDKVWIDETYWKITDKGLIFVKNDGNLPRGLSGNLICVIVAYDKKRHYYCHVVGKRGKISSEDFCSAMKDRIRPGSLLIHDGEHAHKALVNMLSLKEEVIRSDDMNPERRGQMEPIDSVCALLKFETYKHKGIRTRHMEELLPWFLFKTEYIRKNGVKNAVEYILTKLFDTEKTETYDERFNTERRKRKGKRTLEDC